MNTTYITQRRGGGGGGATPTTFSALTDTPGSYAGAAGQVAAVNGTQTGIEFINITANKVDTIAALPSATTVQGGDQYAVSNDTAANNGLYIADGPTTGAGIGWSKA